MFTHFVFSILSLHVSETTKLAIVEIKLLSDNMFPVLLNSSPELSRANFLAIG